uniref:Fibronectin type-III domain-containing protein n=2 Tax=Denticeps clupeoides TaxID=299321 RepID=A0AAY4CH64_9TELE
MDFCSSSAGQCQLSGLTCGQVYNASVVAQDSTCSSPASESVRVRSVPCMPQDVVPVVDCTDNSLSVWWTESDGADSYTATLSDGDGRSTNCQAMDAGLGNGPNHCNISGLACGMLYHVGVEASDGHCDSQPTETVDTPSGPCPLYDIRTMLDCDLSSVVVSWFLSLGAESYVVTGTGLSHHVVTCVTNETTCELKGLLCAEQYAISITARGPTCSSHAIMNGTVQTGPCSPKNLRLDYRMGIGQLSWDRSAGASSYSSEALSADGARASCLTSDTYCALYSLACSKVYNVRVTSHNSVCEGVATSHSLFLETEPCPPTNVQARVARGNGTGVVSWEPSISAVAYKAVFNGRNGDTLVCSSMGTSCSVGALQCGTTYYVSVCALGMDFNSSDSTSVLLVSAPCSPDANTMRVTQSCANASVAVHWAWSDGADSYELTAASDDGFYSACNSTRNDCSLSDLGCGRTYNISLSALNQNNRVTLDTGATFQTRPCTPTRVAVDLQCTTQAAALSWERKDGVQWYVATATTGVGRWVRRCNSTGSSCLFSGLDCGRRYFFSVMAQGSSCISETSSSVDILTAPCQPVNVTVRGSCASQNVSLAWGQANGALVYNIMATGNLGSATTFQTSNLSLVVEVPCGDTYSFRVVARDEACDSPASSPATFRSAPCVPIDVQTYIECEDSIGSVSWAESDGAELYAAIATASDGHPHTCTTNGSSCSWSDLHCGYTYVVHVVAENSLCSSAPSNSTTIHMAPCIPEGLSASLDCNTRVGSVSWLASQAAELYVIRAESDNGQRMSFSTNVTSAQISQLQCGQTYHVSVFAAGPMCLSRSCSPVPMQTEPCVPTNISSFMDCVSNIAVVSWTASVGAEHYTAVMEDSDGQTVSCMSSGARCGVSQLACGKSYSVTVTAGDHVCSSLPSVQTTLSSVPCVPMNVSVVMDCGQNKAVVSWSPSQGTLSYRAFTRSSTFSSCESSSPTCTLQNLTCGAAYSVQVVAMGDSCTSLPSQAADFWTAPCTPQNVSVQMQCGLGAMVITWAASPSAEYFRATAAASSGMSWFCNSTATDCSISNLRCGLIFTVTVTAVRRGCECAPGSPIQVSSAPCGPQMFSGSLDCAINSAWVVWRPAPGADTYTVLAEKGGGSNSSCSTHSNSCNVPNLTCATVYNFSITAANKDCVTRGNETFQLQTAPCSMKNITISTECQSSVIRVKWDQAPGSPLFVATAEGSDLSLLVCNSTSTSCDLQGARCDVEYVVIVSTSSDKCSSLRSPPQKLRTAPCAPGNFTAKELCDLDGVLISWAPSRLAQSFSLAATGRDGDVRTCNTTATSCTLSRLHCGLPYNVTVTAYANNCSSPTSSPFTFHTVPCSPRNVSVYMHCNTSTAVLSWEPSEGAVQYVACAQSDAGNMLTFGTSATSCSITGLSCGSVYNFSAQASDGTCNSSFSPPVQKGAVPCPPASVKTKLRRIGSSDVAMVSWSAVTCPNIQYLVEVMGRIQDNPQALMNMSSYLTDRMFFEFPLPCGSSYALAVRSQNAAGFSKSSGPNSGITAPCPPLGFQSTGNNASAVLNWQAAVFATGYRVYQLGSSGRVQVCNTSALTCEVTNTNLSTLLLTASNVAGESQPTALSGRVAARRKRSLGEAQMLAELMQSDTLSTPDARVSRVTGASLTIEWAAVKGALYYTVILWKDMPSRLLHKVLTVSSQVAVVSDLEPDTRYCVVLTAKDSDSQSPYSHPVCIATGASI